MMDVNALQKTLLNMMTVNIKSKNDINELKRMSIVLNNEMDKINEVIDNRIHELEQEENQ